MADDSRFAVWLIAATCAAPACNVSPTRDSSTGGPGALDAETPSLSDAAGLDGAATGACDRGTIVLLTDFQSTQIALSRLDGTTLSPAFLSTASAKTNGLAFAFSGDVALPNEKPSSGRIVLVDRFGTNVVTWADPATAQVYAQLPVGTGFESNPLDYVETDAIHAYVSRYGINKAPGQQSFDAGSDVLVIDTLAPAITKSIPMPVEDGLPPRPSGMLRVGDTVIVALQRTSDPDFSIVGESALVGIKDDAIAWEVHVTGLKGCDRPSLSPSGREIAIGCGGQLDMNGNVLDASASAIVLYDVTTLPPQPTQRFAISDQLGSGVQSGVAWVSETALLAKTQTALGGTQNDQAFLLDTMSGKATVLLTAGANASGTSKGVVFNDVRCLPGCGDLCLLADSDVGKLRRWKIAGTALQPISDVEVDPVTGLPPVYLGGY